MRPAKAPRLSLPHRILAISAFLLVGLSLLNSAPAFAGGETLTPTGTEPDESSTKTYLTLGVGGSSVGIMGMACLSLESGSLLLSARASATGSLEVGVPDTESRPSKIAITDYSLLVGKTWRRHATRLYAEAGPGLAKITRRGDQILPGPGETFAPYYEMSSEKTLNLAFQAGAREDWSIVGVGLAIVGNVNSGESEVGLALTISLGKMYD
jgi:hypothetical protein